MEGHARRVQAHRHMQGGRAAALGALEAGTHLPSLWLESAVPPVT